MMKKLFTLLFVLCTTLSVGAQGVKPLPSLHVEGKWIVDKHGNHVVLHGVMDTPNMYFNGWHWGSPWTGVNYDANGVKRCREYFSKLFWAFEQAKCDVFRLHLDPAWTNDPSDSYVYEGSAGQASDVTGEADIKKFNPKRLTSFMKSLYFPLAKDAMEHGQFVIMRPPGVCPRDLKVGDYYQQYLLEVWDIVSKNDSVQKYAGQISLELANEPINIRNANNQDASNAMRDYFQPIVNKIRENGFTGIIWIPGTGYQSNYRGYKTYPIVDSNFGYAVHDYPGWYNASDDNPDPVNKRNNFRNAVPVVDTKPIFITEVDWSPLKQPLEFDHYNEWGQPVYKNLGTWATASTSKWGKAFKALLDYFGNISMTLTHPHDFLDIDTLLEKNKVVAAFDANPEACGKACMDWYAEYWKVDWPHSDVLEGTPEYETATALTLQEQPALMMVGQGFTPQFRATYQDNHSADVTSEVTLTSSNPAVAVVTGVVVKTVGYGEAEITASYTDPRGNKVETPFTVKATYFLFNSDYVNAALKGGEGVFNANSKAMKPVADGEIGWAYAAPMDWSGFKYLVLKLRREQTCNAHVNIYTTSDLSGDCFSSEPIGTTLQFVVNLQEAAYTSGAHQGQPLDLTSIRALSFWGDGNGFIQFDDIYLTNNDDFTPIDPAASIATVHRQAPQTVGVYTLSGQLVRRAADKRSATDGLPVGLYIVGGEKVMVR